MPYTTKEDLYFMANLVHNYILEKTPSCSCFLRKLTEVSPRKDGCRLKNILVDTELIYVQYIKGLTKLEKDFTRTCSDRKRGNGLKLKEIWMRY